MVEMEFKEKTFNIKSKYYNHYKTLKRFMSQIYYFSNNNESFREICVLNNNKFCLRALTFKSDKYLQKNLFNKQYNPISFQEGYNLYVSKNRIKRIPMFPFNKDRIKLTNEYFKNNYKNNILHYDYYLDLDIDIDNKKEFNLVIKDLLKIINYLEILKIRFQLVFSGNRGFKVLIFNNTIVTDKNRDFEEETSYNVIHYLIDKLRLKTIDKSIYYNTPSKLMKLNYSLVDKNQDIKIVLPLNKHTTKDILLNILKTKSFDYFSILKNPQLLDNLLQENHNLIYNKNSNLEDVNLLKKISNEYVKNNNIKKRTKEVWEL